MQKMEEIPSLNGQVKIVAPPLLGSCRLAVTLMSMLLSFSNLAMTVNVGIAIVCMKKSLPSVETNTSMTSNCSSIFQSPPDTFDVNTNQQQYIPDWDKNTQGMLLGATFYGVVSMQMIVGWLSDKYGRIKIQMLCGSGLASVATLLSPLIILYTPVTFYFAVRVAIGAAICFSLSSRLPLLNRWKTEREQGLLVGISFAGAGLAHSLAYPISGLLCELAGWQSIFYFAGSLGLLSSISAFFLIYDTPLVHPRISVEEKQYLLSSQKTSKKEKLAIPWKRILCSVPVWSVVVTNLVFFAAHNGVVVNLPLYVKDLLDFTVTENGIFSALPIVAGLLVHLIAGPVFDYVRSRKIFSVTVVRKMFQSVGTIIPAAFMFVVSQLDPSTHGKYLIMALITIGYAIDEVAVMGGFSFCLLDIAPDFVGTLQGINGTIGFTAGFIIPMIVAVLTPDGTREEWSHVFLMFGGLYCLACIVFVITGSAELQSWGKVTKKDENKNERHQV